MSHEYFAPVLHEENCSVVCFRTQALSNNVKANAIRLRASKLD